ncbi:MAG: hypothetical protein A2854_01410 [Parcubacteria group bacterium RIFCSPHIGHO2_01_FULL_56_18]|nr:MAG: hypothetical protein A2854_01410 [Parcubacteria group bacterium RIFCSPHIGHO2_01_FULL_56_18]
MAEKELRQLKEIKKELSEIKVRTSDPKRSFINGILYGAGALVGGIIAVAIIGWTLNVLGIIPGLSELADYIHSLVDGLPR